MEVQGVAFYVIAGDHPQAGPRKLRIGFPGYRSTVGEVRSLLIASHKLHEGKLRIELQHAETREVLPLDQVVANYDTFRLSLTTKRLRDAVEEEAEALQKQQALQVSRMLELATDSRLTMVGESEPGSPGAVVAGRPSLTTSSSASSSSNTVMDTKRLGVVLSKKLPLKHTKRVLEEKDNELCLLCDQVPSESQVMTPCCTWLVCSGCLSYAKSIMTAPGCAVCGSIEYDAILPSSSLPVSTTNTTLRTSAPAVPSTLQLKRPPPPPALLVGKTQQQVKGEAVVVPMPQRLGLTPNNNHGEFPHNTNTSFSPPSHPAAAMGAGAATAGGVEKRTSGSHPGVGALLEVPTARFPAAGVLTVDTLFALVPLVTSARSVLSLISV